MPAQKQKSTLKKESLKGKEDQVAKFEPLKTLLAWKAPERLFKKRDKEYFSTIGAIVFLLAIILIFIKEWFLIIALVALVFVVYVMSTIEPRKIRHEINTRGIKTGGKRYNWPYLGRFWFTQKHEQNILHVESLLNFPRQLIILLGEVKQEEIKKILSRYLPLEEPEKTWMDNASEWLSQRFPLEKN